MATGKTIVFGITFILLMIFSIDFLTVEKSAKTSCLNYDIAFDISANKADAKITGCNYTCFKDTDSCGGGSNCRVDYTCDTQCEPGVGTYFDTGTGSQSKCKMP